MRHPRATHTHTASATKAHRLLVRRRKAARKGVPQINPATKQKDRHYR